MRLLEISIDVGPAAQVSELELLVRGIRVSVDVARDSQHRAARAAVVEQMKYPTDSELVSAAESLSGEDDEDLRLRARNQLDARRKLRDEIRGGPPEFWFDYLYRRRGKFGLELDSSLRSAGLERTFQSSAVPFLSNGIGLDVVDPVLYQALCSNGLRQAQLGDVGVDELRYSNPFFKRLFGRDSAEKTISATAEVIETVGTIGSTRRMARADAAVAEGTVEDRLADSGLDLEMKRLQVEREREALFRDRIENARAVESLNAERVQRSLVEAALREGRVHLADTLGELGDSDAIALGGLASRELEVVEREEDDESAGQ